MYVKEMPHHINHHFFKQCYASVSNKTTRKYLKQSQERRELWPQHCATRCSAGRTGQKPAEWLLSIGKSSL